MTVYGETDDDGGVSGERERSADVVDGGDSCDLSGIRMGFAKLEEYMSAGGEGDSDRSLLVSLPLSSEYMMMFRMVCFCGWEVDVDSGWVCWEQR